MLDGDEAIVGLMGKHLMELKEFPLFFYGQNCGFSLLEAGSAAFFFKLFGLSDVSLKLSALFIWTWGVVFMFLTLKNFIKSNRIAFVLICMFIFCPAWAVWSMKARGGYVTAFLAFSILTWIFTSKNEYRSKTSIPLFGEI